MISPQLHISKREECRSGFAGMSINRDTSVTDRALWIWSSPPQDLVVSMREAGYGVSGKWIYLPGDYQGWHTNADVPGQRIYLSWASESNKSGMKFLVDDQIIDSPDKEGWNIRVFTPPVWHSVYCDCIRASVGFITRDIDRFIADALQPRSLQSLDELLAIIGVFI